MGFGNRKKAAKRVATSLASLHGLLESVEEARAIMAEFTSGEKDYSELQKRISLAKSEKIDIENTIVELKELLASENEAFIHEQEKNAKVATKNLKAQRVAQDKQEREHLEKMKGITSDYEGNIEPLKAEVKKLNATIRKKKATVVRHEGTAAALEKKIVKLTDQLNALVAKITPA